jgi:ABC-2 type transport system permease protein
MRSFAALLLKEEKAIFTSPIAYVVLSVFLVIMGYTFTLTLFVSHVPTLVHLFFQIYVLFLLTVPIITMRLVAEERRLRTIEILLTAPVSEPAVVFAKYLANPMASPLGGIAPDVLDRRRRKVRQRGKGFG